MKRFIEFLERNKAWEKFEKAFREQGRDVKDIKTKIDVKNLNLFYGSNQALFDIDVNLYHNKITALIGPSGCGKSTFLRCINRMNDLIPIVKIDGKIIIDKKNIYDKDVDEVSVRKRVGMVFQQPNPFPK